MPVTEPDPICEDMGVIGSGFLRRWVVDAGLCVVVLLGTLGIKRELLGTS